jgi:apolipoprotein N-acyltransferase
VSETRIDGEAPIALSRPRANRGALALYALLTFLAFGHELPFGWSLAGFSSFDFGLVFAWFVPAALIVGLAGLPPRRAAWVAFWASLLAHTAFFYWFMVVTVLYGGMPVLLGVLAPLAPALYVSLFTALFGYCWARVDARVAVAIPLGAALWVAVDWARGHFLGGFPWATLGYALHLDLPLLAWTRWAGVYGLSFAAAAVGIACGQLFLERSVRSQRRLVVTIATVLALHAIGYAMMFGVESMEGSTPIRVAAIQGNIDQGEKWQSDRRVRILATYLRLSEEAASRLPKPDWIVWPETAVPGLIENDAGLRSRLALLARRFDVSLVVGGMGVEID